MVNGVARLACVAGGNTLAKESKWLCFGRGVV